jgi:DnaJ-class molecular chaperone
MRQSYHKLKNIYHPDKVDKVKLAGKEAQVLQRWDNLQLAFKTLTD